MNISQNGFTLLELLVTIAIAMILLLNAIPNESIFITKSQDEVMSQQLLRAIYLARSEAIARGVSIMLCSSADLKTCSGNWLQGYIVKTNENIISTYQNVTTVGKVNWRLFPKGREDLKFLPSGFLDVENGTFWYCSPDSAKPHWAIVMSPSGRARIELPNEAGDIVDSHSQLLC
jgi:type IV fimbrial biogenesis protein FimT